MTTIVMLALAGAFVLCILAYMTVETDVRGELGAKASASSSSMVARLATRSSARRTRWR